MNKCPTCEQVIRLHRYCSECKQPIIKNHKYKYVLREDYTYKMEHWDCDNPKGYGDKFATQSKKYLEEKEPNE